MADPAPDPAPHSTGADIVPHRGSIVSRIASRLFAVLLLVVCVAGATGLLGGHTSTTSTAGGGYRLTLSYPGTTRPGLDTFWELRIVHPGGFHGSLTVAVSGSYYDLFETQGFYPTPSDTTRDGSYVYLTFTPPSRGDIFTVMYDAYLQPYVAPTNLLANDATVALVRHGERVAAVHYATFVLP